MNGYIILGVILVVVGVLIYMYVRARSYGKITLNLNKFDFSQGEAITGTLNLKLNEPVEAKSLCIKLVGERTSASYTNGKKMSKTETVFDLVRNLDGAKMYLAGEQNYDFEIKVPSNIVQTTGNQIADTLIKSVQILSGQNSRIEWHLLAYLDMKGFNISKKMKIYIN